jgi:hypothetical protein
VPLAQASFEPKLSLNQSPEDGGARTDSQIAWEQSGKLNHFISMNIYSAETTVKPTFRLDTEQTLISRSRNCEEAKYEIARNQKRFAGERKSRFRRSSETPAWHKP